MSTIPIAVRGFSEPIEDDPEEGDKPSGGQRRTAAGWPDSVLVFDTETTTDPAQALVFGCWAYYRWTEQGDLEKAAGGIFYADDLPERDSKAYGVLEAYAEDYRYEMGSDLDRDLGFLSRREFIDEVFYPAAYGDEALVVGFNLPFDLSRLAVRAAPARRDFYGGFSLQLADYRTDDGSWRENPHRPRIVYKTIDSKRALIQFSSSHEQAPWEPHWSFGGRFLDLRTLAFALTNKSHSLQSACEAFQAEHSKTSAAAHGEVTPDYIDYARQDVRATASLLVEVRKEFDRHPVALDPWRAYSPASLAKAYLREMGVEPALDRFEVEGETLGAAMTAYFGGRAEVHLRRTEVPVLYVDFLSMYPTVNVLMDLWTWQQAGNLERVDATEDVQALLSDLDPEDIFDRDLWPQLRFFALVQPDEDIQPIRGEYDPATRGTNIGVNIATSDEPLWVAGPDLVASMLLTGTVPTIERAFRLVPRGQQDGLRAVELGGELPVDPRREDFFQRVIEERKSLDQRGFPEWKQAWLNTALKIQANAGSYGINAEMIRHERPESNPDVVRIHGRDGSFRHETTRPEEPGSFAFPPLAALITAGARLMLTAAEWCIGEKGGTYVLCDTDSMVIVATPQGDLVPCPGGSHRTKDGEEAVRALSFEDVSEIQERFESLHPYDRERVPQPILELEEENFVGESEFMAPLRCVAISAKRYVLYRDLPDGGIEVVKASEHGLGHLLNPIDPDSPSTGWIEEFWKLIIRRVRGEEIEFPHWMDRPAVSRMTISTPRLLKSFPTYSDHLPYDDQMKPANFILTVPTASAPPGHPPGTDPQEFSLVAPYTRDPGRWLKMPWINKYTGEEFRISTTEITNPDVAVVKSFRDVFEEFFHHPEVKSAGPDGEPCGPQTVGLLQRRQIEVAHIYHVGKESNRLDEVRKGAVANWDEIRETYETCEEDGLEAWVIPVLKRVPKDFISEETGITARTVARIRNGHRTPRDKNRRKLELFAKEVLADPSGIPRI